MISQINGTLFNFVFDTRTKLNSVVMRVISNVFDEWPLYFLNRLVRTIVASRSHFLRLTLTSLITHLFSHYSPSTYISRFLDIFRTDGTGASSVESSFLFFSSQVDLTVAKPFNLAFN